MTSTRVNRIALRGVTVSRGRRVALTDITAEFPRGVTALLGLNGAGKSTLLDTIGGYLSPQAGQVDVAASTTVGYLPQQAPLAPGVTPRRVIEQSLWIHGTPAPRLAGRAAEVLAEWKLDDIADTAVRRLSGGMKARVAFAAAVAHDPAVLLLDEPTVGLDASRLREVRELVATQRDRVVIISSHIAADVEALADRVLLLDGGRARFSGTVDDLLAEAGESTLDDAIISITRRAA